MLILLYPLALTLQNVCKIALWLHVKKKGHVDLFRSKVGKYARACMEEQVSFPPISKGDYDGVPFIQDKRLAAAEFADHAQDNHWTTLRLGGQLSWMGVYMRWSLAHWNCIVHVKVFAPEKVVF
jgi:hypothetical protein